MGSSSSIVLTVQTADNKETYMAGQTIHGEVHLKANVDIPAAALQVSLMAIENTRFSIQKSREYRAFYFA
jgi:hypothetical protein